MSCHPLHIRAMSQGNTIPKYLPLNKWQGEWKMEIRTGSQTSAVMANLEVMIKQREHNPGNYSSHHNLA